MKKILLISSIIILLDQIVKIYIKLHYNIGQEVDSYNLFGYKFMRVIFEENEGMAFGSKIPLPSLYAKPILTILRVLIISFIIRVIYKSVKNGLPNIIIIALGLILAGAIGNLLDSLFYGMIFSESNFVDIAQFMPKDKEVYSSFLNGSVVDMFLFNIYFPSWMPFGMGSKLAFPFIFNIADSAITIGMILFIIKKNSLKYLTLKF